MKPSRSTSFRKFAVGDYWKRLEKWGNENRNAIHIISAFCFLTLIPINILWSPQFNPRLYIINATSIHISSHNSLYLSAISGDPSLFACIRYCETAFGGRIIGNLEEFYREADCRRDRNLKVGILKLCVLCLYRDLNRWVCVVDVVCFASFVSVSWLNIVFWGLRTKSLGNQWWNFSNSRSLMLHSIEVEIEHNKGQFVEELVLHFNFTITIKLEAVFRCLIMFISTYKYLCY